MSVIFAISITFVISAIFVIFIICFFTFLFLTALTTPLNLGGCVTDYRYHTKTSFCLTYVPLCFLTLYVSLLVRHRRHSLAIYLMYLYHLISIDLQLSRLCNSLYCKAYILYTNYAINNNNTQLFYT